MLVVFTVHGEEVIREPSQRIWELCVNRETKCELFFDSCWQREKRGRDISLSEVGARLCYREDRLLYQYRRAFRNVTCCEDSPSLSWRRLELEPSVVGELKTAVIWKLLVRAHTYATILFR